MKPQTSLPIRKYASLILLASLTSNYALAREAARNFNAGTASVGASASLEFFESITDPYSVTLKGYIDAKLNDTVRRSYEGLSKLELTSNSDGRASGSLKAHGETLRSWDVGFTAKSSWNIASVILDGPSADASLLGFTLKYAASSKLSATGAASVAAQRNARPKVTASITPLAQLTLKASLGATLPFGIASASIKAVGSRGTGAYRLATGSLTGSVAFVPQPSPAKPKVTTGVKGFFEGPLGQVILTARTPDIVTPLGTIRGGNFAVPVISWNSARTNFVLLAPVSVTLP